MQSSASERTLLLPVAVGLCFFAIVSKILYDLFYNPLKHIPGPRLNAISRIPYVRHHMVGTVAPYLQKLHEEYGEVVRYSPNEVSFISGETAWPDLYGFRIGRWRGRMSHLKDPVWFAPPPNQTPGLLIANDEDHSRGRRILAHAFSEKALNQQEALLQSYGDQLVDGLKDTISSSSASVNMTKWWNWLTFDIISHLLFGEPFGCLQNLDTHKHVSLLLTTIKAMRLYYVMHHFPWMKYLGSLFVSQSQLQSRAEYLEWVGQQTRKRIASDTQETDFMTEILKHNDPSGKGGGLSENEIISNAILLLNAGTETTATVLSATTYLLSKNPTVLSKLQDEVRGRWKTYSEITLEQVNSAPYLLAVLSETLRFFPPVPTGFLRVVSKGGENVSGYYIPEGTSVCVSSHAAHHSTRNFTDPDSFVPERWMGDERYANDKREGVQPFSYGPRNCLGKNLAYAEMRLFLAKFIWTFDFELEEKSSRWMDECKVMVIWQKPELLVRLKQVQRA